MKQTVEEIAEEMAEELASEMDSCWGFSRKKFKQDLILKMVPEIKEGLIKERYTNTLWCLLPEMIEEYMSL